MSIASQSTGQKFPFAADVVYKHLLDALNAEGFKIKEQDSLIKRVTASAGMSLFSWGENLSLSVEEVDTSSCRLSIDSALKVGVNVAGAHRHQKNFDKIIMAVSRRLQQASS